MKESMKVYQVYENPLPPTYRDAIRQELVANVPADEPYIDANSKIYGMRIQQLKGIVVVYMEAVHKKANHDNPKLE